MCGRLRPDLGDIIFEGRSLSGLPTYRRARLGIGRTYQKVEVFTDMSVRDHLMVAERARRGEGRLWRDLLNLSKPTADETERVDATLELVGIAHLADTSVNALGLGNCRLVELARALAAEPRILLADEPSSGLDVDETAELASVLRTVQRERGPAILLVEHDLDMVADAVDRVVAMDLGSVLAEGSFGAVIDDPPCAPPTSGRSARRDARSTASAPIPPAPTYCRCATSARPTGLTAPSSTCRSGCPMEASSPWSAPTGRGSRRWPGP